MLRFLFILIFTCTMATASFGAKPKGKPASKAATKTMAKKSVKKSSSASRKPASAKATKNVKAKTVVTKKKTAKAQMKPTSKNTKKPSMQASKSKPAKPSRAPAEAKPEFSSMAAAEKADRKEVRSEMSSSAMNYRTPSALGDGKALQVTGQNRNLNMSLILGGKSDKVDFGEVRENYRREVIGTQY